MGHLSRLVFVMACWLVVLVYAGAAHAETLEAPIGGKPIAFGDRTLCAPLTGGWSLEPDGRLLRPPSADEAVGQIVTVRVGASTAACSASKDEITLVATGRWPTFDPAATTLAVDEGRLEVRGKRLRGVRIAIHMASQASEDTCLEPKVDGTAERCVLAAARGLAADPSKLSLSWLPAGARTGADSSLFDAEGRRAAAADFLLPSARIAVASLLPAGAAVDFISGARRVTLLHPEAVAAVECGPVAECVLEGDGVAVRGLAGGTSALPLRLRLFPHVALAHGDAFEVSPSLSVPVMVCPLAVISGAPLRGVDDARIVVRLAGACARDASILRYRIRGVLAEPIRLVGSGDSVDAVLRAGRLEDGEVSISVLRPEPDASIVALTRAATRPAPVPHATLELPGHGPVDFIPTNRTAALRVTANAAGLRFVLVPVAGVYDVAPDGGVRGAASLGGFVALRFAYRAEGLPAALGDTDLGFVTEAVERPLHPANLPAALGVSDPSVTPLVEVVCDTGEGKLLAVRQGRTAHVPYPARDGCRLVFHRARLAPDGGTQKLTLEIEVARADGTPRGEAHVTQPIVLRPGGEARVVWIKGANAPFDRINVRLSHTTDESHYVAGEEVTTAAPAAQWSIIMGTSRARLYTTTAIPTGLYRVSDHDHSGILTLNFGVLGRLTWLGAEGDEGVLGLEAGVIGVGLANDTSSSGKSLTQVATVLGAGLGVPIANRSSPLEASINLHAWLEFEPSRALGSGGGSPLGFVFGPSITLGNIGTNF